MEYIRSDKFNIDCPTVVTFGKFDGIHIGHKILVEEAVRIAESEGLKVVLCTFDMSGWLECRIPQISLADERCRLCEKLGVDVLLEYPFDDDMATMEPEAFVEEFIQGKLNAKYVIVGTDWRFGINRSGDVSLLSSLQEKYGYKAVVMDKYLKDGREISSTWIREEIKKGNMEEVAELLGYPYSVSGKVLHGNQIGRTIGFPTINFEPEKEKILPPFGAYVSSVTVDGISYKAVTNVGMKPTVEGNKSLTVETHILDFAKDVYDDFLEVSLLHFIRPETKFESFEALKKQLKSDVENSLTY